jgi:hypothetical protein
MAPAQRESYEVVAGEEAAAAPQSTRPPDISMSFLRKKGAAAIPLARHWDMERDDPGPAEWLNKNAHAPRRKAGAREVRLCGSGLLVGYVHPDVPQRPRIDRNRDGGKFLSLVTPHGEVRGLSVVAEQRIQPINRGDIPGFESEDDHFAVVLPFNRWPGSSRVERGDSGPSV